MNTAYATHVAIYNLPTLCVDGTCLCVDFMDVIPGGTGPLPRPGSGWGDAALRPSCQNVHRPELPIEVYRYVGLQTAASRCNFLPPHVDRAPPRQMLPCQGPELEYTLFPEMYQSLGCIRGPAIPRHSP